MKNPVENQIRMAKPVQSEFETERRRILLLSNELGVGGGAEEQVMLLSLGLRARGWTVKIVSLLPLNPLWSELKASDIPLASLGMKAGVPDPRAMLGLIKELRGFRPDIVHCHLPQSNLLARAVRPFYPLPVLISTLHSLTMERTNGSSGRFLELAHRWTDRYADLTTVICAPAVTSYVERGAVPANKIAIVYNGVNTNNFRADPLVRKKLRRELELDGKFAWLAIGRFERPKAYPNMIRAFARVAANAAQDVVLLICGSGSLENEIRAEIRACGVAERVKFLGLRRDIPDVMNAADAFVMSSYLEGLPMVLLEASSVGMPIVATDVGGNAEVVIDGLNGFVVPPSDDAALAAAMQRVLELPDAERSLMAEHGRRLAREKFEIQRILDRWEALYGELLSKNFQERSRLAEK
jgi:glycosyltransferase involved in cell wall biosynthesis